MKEQHKFMVQTRSFYDKAGGKRGWAVRREKKRKMKHQKSNFDLKLTIISRQRAILIKNEKENVFAIDNV